MRRALIASCLALAALLMLTTCSDKGTESKSPASDPPPSGSLKISYINRAFAYDGDTTTVFGRNFGAGDSTSGVTVAGQRAHVLAWSDTIVTFELPDLDSLGFVASIRVHRDTLISNGYDLPIVGIRSVTPSYGYAGDSITVRGLGFMNWPSLNSFSISGVGAPHIWTWTDTMVVITIPEGISTGEVIFKRGDRRIPGGEFATFWIESIHPDTLAIEDTIVITGIGFGQEGRHQLLLGDYEAEAIVWDDTLITAVVPHGMNSGIVTVNVGHLTNHGTVMPFVLKPKLTSMTPSFGTYGDTVAIMGSQLSGSYTESWVRFGGKRADVLDWSYDQITTSFPVGCSDGEVVVTVGLQTSNGLPYEVFGIESAPNGILDPGSEFTVRGTGFDKYTWQNRIMMGDRELEVVRWRDTQIDAIAPDDIAQAMVVVELDGRVSNGFELFVNAAPIVDSITPRLLQYDHPAVVHGKNLLLHDQWASPMFGSFPAEVHMYSTDSLVIEVPFGCKSGDFYVNRSGIRSNVIQVDVFGVASVEPEVVEVGDLAVVRGSGFGAEQETSEILINDLSVAVNIWSDKTIALVVPEGATDGDIRVKVDELYSNAVDITVLERPVLTSISPETATFGDTLHIFGYAFGSEREDGEYVTIGDRQAKVTSWSETEISVIVTPADESSEVRICADGFLSNPLTLNVTGILKLSNYQFNSGDTISVLGTGFGSYQGIGLVMFGDRMGNALYWSSDSIQVEVPYNLTSDTVYVSRGYFSSNAVHYVNSNTDLLSLLHQTVNVEIEYHGEHCVSTSFDRCYCDTARMGNFIPAYSSGYIRTILIWEDRHCSAYYRGGWEGSIISYSHQLIDFSCVVGDDASRIDSLNLRSYHDAHTMAGPQQWFFGYLSLNDLPLEQLSLGESVRISFFASGQQVSESVSSQRIANWRQFPYFQILQTTDYSDPECPPWIRVTFTGPLPE